MMKNLLLAAAFAALAAAPAAAQTTTTSDLTLVPGWNCAGTISGAQITCNSQWGQYHLYNAEVSLADYKGCILEYTTAAEGWQFKIEEANEAKTEHYMPLDPATNSIELSFADYEANPKYIDLQGTVVDAAITLKSFSLVKTDGTAEPVNTGSAFWGVTIGAYAAPCGLVFEGQYGGATLKLDGKDITLAMGAEEVLVFTVTLAAPAPYELNMEADNEKQGFAWSWPNLLPGETEFTFTLDGATITDNVASVWLKCADANPTAEPVQIASVTLSSTSGVAAIESTDAPAEFFNLQGVRVANPENGIFIRRQGNKVSKVVVR